MRAQLVPVENGPPLEITKDMTLVGRGEGCDLRLDHKSISKLHCVLVKTDGLILLRDLGSTNGTRVNGQRVRRAALLPNDQIHIASLKFRVLFGAKALPQFLPEEKTQQIGPGDLARLLKDKQAEPADSEELPVDPVKANVLPDVYPEESKADAKKPENK
jgi:pSer/pThr/pTyr-binding forkhead associated (FHA) protein